MTRGRPGAAGAEIVCPNCEGVGALPMHEETCRSDMCVLNGDYWSCNGSYVTCDECMGEGLVWRV